MVHIPVTGRDAECYELGSPSLQRRMILYKHSSTRQLDWKLLMKCDEFQLEVVFNVVYTGGCAHLFVEALLVLLMDEAVLHTPCTNCDNRNKTGNDANLVERWVEDRLMERRNSKDQTVRGNLEFFPLESNTRTELTCKSSWSIGRLDFNPCQWSFALCSFAVDICRPERRRLAMDEADRASANVMVSLALSTPS
jgi:hypothetical protein